MVIRIAVLLWASFTVGWSVMATGRPFDGPLQQRSAETAQRPRIPRSADAVYSASAMGPLYEFAAAHPEVLKKMPCFCSCGTRLGHGSNLDCFVSSRSADGTVVWNAHAAECQICVTVARDAKQLFEAGLGLTEIRQRIEATYGVGSKYHTSTPWPGPGK